MDAEFLLKSNSKSYVLYRMVTLPVAVGTSNPQTTPISTFCIAFHIFVVDEHRDFKFLCEGWS